MDSVKPLLVERMYSWLKNWSASFPKNNIKRGKHPCWKAFQPELSRSSEDSSSTTSTSLSDFEDFTRPGTNFLQRLLISTLPQKIVDYPKIIKLTSNKVILCWKKLPKIVLVLVKSQFSAGSTLQHFNWLVSMYHFEISFESAFFFVKMFLLVFWSIISFTRSFQN